MPIADVLRESQYPSPPEKNPSSPSATGFLARLGELSNRYNQWLEGEGESPVRGALESPIGRLVRRVGRGLPHEEATQPTAGLTTQGLLGAGSIMDMPQAEAFQRGLVAPAGEVAPFTTVAGQISGAHAPGTNLGVPAYRYGSAAQYRMPMRLRELEEVPYWRRRSPDYPYDLTARYEFRNPLGEPPLRGSAQMELDPKTGTAHLAFLRLENPQGYTRGLPFGTSHPPGATPAQMKNVVGRLSEELASAGYTKVVSEPLSRERGRLFSRVARQLKREGKLPEAMTYEQDLTRYAENPAASDEGRALRMVRQRKEQERLRAAAGEGEVTEREATVQQPWYEREVDPNDDIAVAAALNNPAARRDAEETIRQVIPGIAARPEEFEQAVDDLLMHRRMRGGPPTIEDVMRAEPPWAQGSPRSPVEPAPPQGRYISAENYPSYPTPVQGQVTSSTAEILRNAAPQIGEVRLPSGMTVNDAISRLTEGNEHLPLHDVTMILDLLGIGTPSRYMRPRP